MLSSTTQSIRHVGNGSTSTPYPVPFDYKAADHVKVSILPNGSGTVTIVDGVVTFSVAQTTLEVGQMLRIAGTDYEINTRTSDTVFSITDHTVDVASTTFKLPAEEDELTAGSEFTLVEIGVGSPYVTTATAYPSTTTVRVFRRVPLTQLATFPQEGPWDPSAAEDALDLVVMMAQQIIGEDGNDSDVGTLPVPGGGTGRTSFTAFALLAAGTTTTAALQQVSNAGASAGWALVFVGTSALPVWAAVGDMTGPAGGTANAVPIFSGTTGKALKDALGTNDANGGAALNLGSDTDTTARFLTISKIWNNAGLTGGALRVVVTSTASALGSWLQQWMVGASNRGKLMRDGELRLLDGSATLPTFSFEAAIGTGMYRDSGGGALAHSVEGVTAYAANTTVFQCFKEFLVTIATVDIFQVTAAGVTAFLPLVPATDAAVDLGSLSFEWKDLYLSGNIQSRFHRYPFSGISVASASTIALTHPVVRVTGTAAIDTITPPAWLAGETGEVTLLPGGVFTWTNADNIAVAGTAVVGRQLKMMWEATLGKWFPSYV